MSIRIECDDQLLEFMDKVNAVLANHGMEFRDDGQEHDGFCIYDLVKTESKSESHDVLARLCERIEEMAQWEEYPNPQDVLNLIQAEPNLAVWWMRRKG